MDPVSLHQRGVDVSTRLVEGISDDQWTSPTPCADWDVRRLVGHLTEEHAWVPPLVAGRTVGEIGSVDAELGDDPVAAHDDAARAAQSAIEEPGALGRTVHLSYADVPGSFYVLQRTADLVIHSWDLAVATGQELALDDDLVQAAWDATAPHVSPEVREAGVFGPEVPVPDDAPLLDRLLGLTGRDPSRADR
ncbi:MAG: TIGR03086 family protein [Actinobacteria bacterium]|nr:TIGR03086 family protein [Actinomycetota bacterium]